MVSYLLKVPKHRKRRFIVELHDVYPDTLSLVTDDLKVLKDLGIDRIALGVVPGRFDAKDLPSRDFLHQCKSQGHELLVHGFLHRSDLSMPRDPWGRLAQWLTHGEAEFAGLHRNDVKNLIQRSIQSWDALELGRAGGFVAPTWWGSEDLLPLALQVGWPVVEERFWLTYKGKYPRLHSIPLSLAGLPPGLGRLSMGLFALFGSWIPGIPRLVLHPGEISGSKGSALVNLTRSWMNWGEPSLFSDLAV